MNKLDVLALEEAKMILSSCNATMTAFGSPRPLPSLEWFAQRLTDFALEHRRVVATAFRGRCKTCQHQNCEDCSNCGQRCYIADTILHIAI